MKKDVATLRLLEVSKARREARRHFYPSEPRAAPGPEKPRPSNAGRRALRGLQAAPESELSLQGGELPENPLRREEGPSSRTPVKRFDRYCETTR